MKCRVPRCNRNSVEQQRKQDSSIPLAPELPLCGEHQKRYQKDYRVHYGPMVQQLSRRWRVTPKVAQERIQAVFDEAAEQSKVRSWVAHWLEMIDCEMLNELMAPPPLPSAPVASYTVLHNQGGPLPESATRAGQAAIAKRLAEQQLLEQRLAAEVADFTRGQRQVLELELKTKRETERRAASARKAKS